MTNNPILNDLRVTRERLLSESGGTVSGLLERLRSEQEASDSQQAESSDNKTMDPSTHCGGS